MYIMSDIKLGALYMEVGNCKVWFVKPDKLETLLETKGPENKLAEYNFS